MRTTILVTAAVGLSLLASLSRAAESEREAYNSVREKLLAQDEIDSALELFDQALKEHPDSAQLKSLHMLFSSYLLRANRPFEAAKHADAAVELWLEKLNEAPAHAASFASIVEQMTIAYRAGDAPKTALERMDGVIARVEALQTEIQDAQIAALVAQLQAKKAVFLSQIGKQEEATALFAELKDRLHRELEAHPDDPGKILALANVLAVRGELAQTVDEAKVATSTHLEFLADQAEKHSNNAPIIATYYNAARNSLLTSVAATDSAVAESQLQRLQTFVGSLQSDDPQIKELISRAEREFEYFRRKIEMAKLHQELIGKPAFPLDAEAWVNGDPLTDEDLQGKVVLLDFWAVWCGPCIATFPHLREWREKYGDEGLVIIGATRHYGYDWDDEAKSIKRVEDLSPEDEQAAMVRFAKHHELEHPFMVMPQGSDFSKKYGVTGIPTAVLIDREGLVRMIRVGSGEQNAKDLEALIEELVHGTSEAAGG